MSVFTGSVQSYTLDEICEEIGISRRSLCYVLKKWRKEGILKGKEKRDRIADHEQLMQIAEHIRQFYDCLLYTSPSPRDRG